MIVLTHPYDLPDADHWKSRLEDMTVPHLLVPSNIKVPVIQEGEWKFEGVWAINQFLDEYELDVQAWNQDRCDMWFFDQEG